MIHIGDEEEAPVASEFVLVVRAEVVEGARVDEGRDGRRAHHINRHNRQDDEEDNTIWRAREPLGDEGQRDDEEDRRRREAVDDGLVSSRSICQQTPTRPSHEREERQEASDHPDLPFGQSLGFVEERKERVDARHRARVDEEEDSRHEWEEAVAH